MIVRSVVKPKSLLKKSTVSNTGTKTITRSAYTKKIVDAKSYQKIDRNELPLSPHVTIYKFPLNAIASISHRVTGMILFTGMPLFFIFFSAEMKVTS